MEDTCERIRELVPWVANSAAEAGERQLVHRHVACCAECRRELAQALALRIEVSRSLSSPSGLAPTDWLELEAALPRLAGDRGHQLVRKVAAAMDLLGLPTVLSGTLSSALDLSGYRPVIWVNLPIVAQVEVGL